MTRNKDTCKVTTDKADDVVYDNTITGYFNKSTFFSNQELGAYNSNNNILQMQYGYYSKDKPNLQSAIDVLSTAALIPIGGIYSKYTSSNPNVTPEVNQVDEIILQFTGGSGDVAAIGDTKIVMYGIVILIPDASEVEDIKPILEANLNGSGLFKAVQVVTTDSATFPFITITITHNGIQDMIPCYTKNEAGDYKRSYSNIDIEANITQTGGSSTSLGYGTWTYLGQTDLNVTGGTNATETIHLFRRDS